MVSVNKELQCYNKGCGKTFNSDNNGPEACTHHPGVPNFHDAYKGWTCCTKKSTDFSEFLSIPGCTKSTHSNVKPVEPVKEKSTEPEISIAEQLEKHKPPEMTPRPVTDEPLEKMTTTVAASLRTALEKMKDRLKEAASDIDDVSVPVGTCCKNATCKTVSGILSSEIGSTEDLIELS